MKRIFRSIIDIKNKTDKSTIEQSDLVRNYRSFLASTVQPEDPTYVELYHLIEAHYRDYKELPDFQLIRERAEKAGNEGILASLQDIISEVPYIGSNYKEILKEKFNEQCKERLQSVLTKTWQAATEGLTLGKKKIQGLSPAVEYFISESRHFKMGNLNLKTASNIRTEEDSKEVIKAYKDKKANPLQNLGMYTFLDRIDDSCRGLKLGELMMVAAYVKQGKTILTTNLAYNGSMQGLNGLFVTLEMNFNEMRDMVYVLHTANPEWLHHPKYKNLVGKVTYDKVCYGELSEFEQEFFDYASSDFPKRDDFGSLFIEQPIEALTPSRLEMLAYDYDAQLKDDGKKLDYLIVDYVGLMTPDKTDKYGDWNIDLNNIIKKLKNLALNFNQGQMLRIITPFQINRSGHKEAEKNDGVFKLSALSNANESERSCDLIISTFMSEEMKKAGLLKIACMAHRKGGGFDPFDANIDFGPRQIREFIQKKKMDEMDKELSVQDIALDIA